MKELLEEEDKDAAAAAVSQKKKKAKMAGKDRRRDAADGQDGSQKKKHTVEQKDTERTEAKAVYEKKQPANVAAVAVAAVAAALKDKVEERVGKEEEGGKQGAAERKKAECAGTSLQGIQGRGLSREKDDDDGFPDESPATRKSKSKKKNAGDQGASASKTAPWATEAKEAGAAAAGVGVEAKSWPLPLQADVEQAAACMSLMPGAAATYEGEKLFMAKFNLWPSETSSGEAQTAGSANDLRPAAVPEVAPVESKSRAAPAGAGAGPRFTYQSLSIATNNFENRLGGGGCGSVFQGVLASGTRVAVKRLELGVAAGAGEAGLSMTDQMRTEVEVLSRVQHVNIVQLMGWSKDGMAPCLVYALMQGGSLQDRLACRGALVPLTANERVLVLSDVARGLAYLHSEVRVIHRDVKSANVLLDEGCRGRIGDFGIARSLEDNGGGITFTHVQTEHVMGTQVYTGYAVCSPAPGHRDLLSMFHDELDTADNLLAHLDTRACWDQHKQERIASLFAIADRCLEARRKKRSELVELIPELEEVRRGTDALPADARAPIYMGSFHCPLTMEVMRDPVITADGQTYERAEIKSWFALGKRTSPLTGAELPSTHVTPNIALRHAIQESGRLNQAEQKC
jgi:hypothetical protein